MTKFQVIQDYRTEDGEAGVRLLGEYVEADEWSTAFDDAVAHAKKVGKSARVLEYTMLHAQVWP